jgi:replication-associated recombination protein RarA
MSYYIKHNPSDFESAILPPNLRRALASMVSSGNLQNMLFYGRPGIGKSSTAKLFSTNTRIIRCDGMKTPAELVPEIRRAASSMNMFDDGRRVLVLDEIDRLSNAAQEKLRAVIDETGAITTFIGTTNEIDDVIPALKSRMTPINFNIEKGNVSVRDLWSARLTAIFKLEMGAEPPTDRLNYALRFFPDGRQMITNLLTPLPS